MFRFVPSKKNLKNIIAGVTETAVRGFNNLLARRKEAIRTAAVSILRDEIERSAEMRSLLSSDVGGLRSLFGLSPQDAETQAKTLVDKLLRAVRVNTGNVTKNKPGKIQLTLDIKSFAFDPQFVSLSESGAFPWLNWLIARGDTIVISGYRVAPVASGRSGVSGIMLRKEGEAFRVPPEFSGTLDNNFLTRSLSRAEDRIERAIRQNLRQ